MPKREKGEPEYVGGPDQGARRHRSVRRGPCGDDALRGGAARRDHAGRRTPQPAHAGQARLCPPRQQAVPFERPRAHARRCLSPRRAHRGDCCCPSFAAWSSRFGGAASVTVLDGHDILYIAHHSEERANRIFAGVGVTYPAYPTSMGRVLLAGLPADKLEAYLKDARLEKLTEFTVTDRDKLCAIIGKGAEGRICDCRRRARLRHHGTGRADPRPGRARGRGAEQFWLFRPRQDQGDDRGAA